MLRPAQHERIPAPISKDFSVRAELVEGPLRSFSTGCWPASAAEDAGVWKPCPSVPREPDSSAKAGIHCRITLKAWARPEVSRVSRTKARGATIVITGFHRSGTSLFAEYLQRCGLFIGHNVRRGGVLPSGSRTGHHEDQQIVGFQRAVLRNRAISNFATDRSGLPIRFTESETEAAKKIIEDRSARRTWGWKSPVTCLFLDAWDALLDRAFYVFLLRDPRQATDSLVRRNRDAHIVRNPTLGARSWIVFNQQILEFVRRNPERRRVIDIEHLLADPSGIVTQLNEAFDVALTPVSFGSVFEPRFLHRRVSDAIVPAMERDPEVFGEALDLYRRLRASC